MSRARRPPPSSDDHGRLDEPIAALIPPALPRSLPAPLDIAALTPPPRPHPPLQLDIARLDASGRFTSRPLLRALGWSPADALVLHVGDDAVVLTPDGSGTVIVGSRGEIAIPAPVRTMAGLDRDPTVALVAAIDRDTLTVHPVALLARLLTAHYHRPPGGGR
ncbi:hypothetical protein [Actinoplanes sp. NPDC089786]|uniref:hypothetical protein n=1 Tax=Actinoplanes sp. NPDC089786 TaxID=3155185 RepID=UPI00341DB98F